MPSAHTHKAGSLGEAKARWEKPRLVGRSQGSLGEAKARWEKPRLVGRSQGSLGEAKAPWEKPRLLGRSQGSLGEAKARLEKPRLTPLTAAGGRQWVEQHLHRALGNSLEKEKFKTSIEKTY